MISTYQDTFAGSPWFENWSSVEVKEIIQEALNQDEFVGKVIKQSSLDDILAFVWGYKVPSVNTQTVCFSQIYDKLKELGKEDFFYLAECGVIQESQNKGLGKLILEEFQKEVPNLIFRTKNENMLKVIEDVYGEIRELFYDPVNSDRMWYEVSRK